MSKSCWISPLRVLLFSILSIGVPSKQTTDIVRGIDPSLSSRYDSNKGNFQCLDGIKEIPFKHVNDGFCDCFDGSDEPGTAGCPSGAFYCQNIGSEPRVLNASFVDDGVCDCCDGSDEPFGRCSNSCLRQAEAAISQLRTELKEVETGLHSRSQYIKEAKETRILWESEIEKIESSLPQAEAAATSLGADKDRLAAQVQALQEKKHALEASFSRIESTLAEKNEGKNIDAGNEQKEEYVPKSQANVEFAPEQPEDVAEEVETEENRALRVASQWIPSERRAEESQMVDETREQEEYSGYEHDADDDWPSVGYDDEGMDAGYYENGTEEDSIEEKEFNSDDSRGFRNAIESDLEVLELDIGVWGKLKAWIVASLARLRGHKSVELELERISTILSSLEARASSAKAASRKASEKLKELKRQQTDLRRRLQLMYGSEDAFLPLSKRCLSLSVDKYTYEVCPFDSAKQVDSGHTTSLGLWDGFLESESLIMNFERGDSCWQGPARSMKVEVFCGSEDKLLQVEEPSRCEYAALMKTPAACSHELLQHLRESLERKVTLHDLALKASVNDEL